MFKYFSMSSIKRKINQNIYQNIPKAQFSSEWVSNNQNTKKILNRKIIITHNAKGHHLLCLQFKDNQVKLTKGVLIMVKLLNVIPQTQINKVSDIC